MAEKKLSGFRQRERRAQRRYLESVNENPASPFFGLMRFAKRKPTGKTERHRELQAQIHMDLAWLGLPYKPDLYSFLWKNLRDPQWRKEYQLTPPECPAAYKTIHKRHFRRETAFVHWQIWGKGRKKESRSLWQHWRHQNYRLTRVSERGPD